MSKRLIKIIGSINEESFSSFCDQMDRYEASGKTPIYVELSSGGGAAYDALAFLGRIRNSPCEVVVTGYGLVASAAVLVLAAGDTRYMARDSWVMVHEDSGKLKGTVVDLEREAAHLRRMEIQWNKILAELSHYKTTASVWADLHSNTTYLSAIECLRLGLIDEVLL